jgi:hypothetical protein
MSRFHPAFIAFVALVSCAGPSNAPGPANGVMPGTLHALSTRSDKAASWMEAQLKRQNLLYISDDYTDDVYVYTFPGGKSVGRLTGFGNPQGLCVDKTGNVYVTDALASKITEYAHGGNKPIKTLQDANTPEDCAVDPRSGNLAVTDFLLGIAIYAKAKGNPHYISYSAPSYNAFLFNCAYDNKGNLFVDGYLNPQKITGFYQFVVGELPKGSQTLSTIWYPEGSQSSNGAPGGLQWHNAQLAVGDSASGVIYMMPGGRISLQDANNVDQFWVHGSTLIGPNNGSTTVMFWNYPAGGAPTKTLSGFARPYGATVSPGL